jgi:hypothetical protein
VLPGDVLTWTVPDGGEGAPRTWEDFSARHRAECPRCQEYGVANVDVDYE